MKEKIIGLVLVVLLMGLVLPGCSTSNKQVDGFKDPSYGDLIDFLAEDQVEKESHESHATYTYLFLKNAKEKGIRGYPVAVVLSSHQILLFAGFETTDKGWTYILPAIDRAVVLEEGKSYREINKFSPFNPSDDVILEIMIFQ